MTFKNPLHCNFVKPEKVDFHDILFKKLLKTVLSFENLSLYFRPFAVVYQRVFYDKMIEKEIKLTEVTEKSNIAHIGSGPFPMTAIKLTVSGHKVDCFDIDYEAIKKSKKLICKRKLNNQISVNHISDDAPDYAKYDIVIVSLHIVGKHDVLDEIIKKLPQNSVIVYRNARGLLKNFYENFYPEPGQFEKVKRIKQFFFKESVALFNQ